MRIRILGCSGGIGAGSRTSAMLVDDDVLIDAGTGIGDLALEEIDSIRHVFLTHAHLDHIAGLPDAVILSDEMLERFDADLDIRAGRVADTRVPVEDVGVRAIVQSGQLSAPFRGKIAGVAVDGRLRLTGSEDVPAVSLEAKAGPVAANEVKKRLNLPNELAGTVSAISFEGNARGRTLRSLLNAARVDLRLQPANLRYRDATKSAIEIQADEEKSADSECTHANEVAGFVLLMPDRTP